MTSPTTDQLAAARAAVEAGDLVIVPTDTVYGLAAHAADEQAVARMYAAKGRDGAQATAVLFASREQLRDTLPALSRRARWAIDALLPGPWTLIVANPTGALPWLTGGVPGPIGVRVPAGALDLPPLAATSANLAGEPTIDTVDQLPPALADLVAVTIDVGPIAGGSASTVLDLTAWETGTGDIRVLRDDAGRAAQAAAALTDAP